MQTFLALVHHANQYLITDGYTNREGLADVIGHPGGGSGLAHILDLHARFAVPINLHISGTLLEAVAWHQPEFIAQIRDLIRTGLVELVGSSYGQNIMRFFGADYNRRQLNEELLLYQMHLDVEPQNVKSFWPPERVWDTRRMAPVLRDARLLNDGYRYVILDDRTLLGRKDPNMPRTEYDQTLAWSPELYQMHEVANGLGLIAFPIATRLRRSIPPRKEEDWNQVQSELEALLVESSGAGEGSLLALYADDMEKAAGIGNWGADRPKRYEEFLAWLSETQWIRPVKLCDWAALNQPAGTREIELGTFDELANEFDAGEGYERWYLSPQWAPYRAHFTWAEKRVNELTALGADPSLTALADKQLLVGNWETAWHTPPVGPHGDAEDFGRPSDWACALTSHSRHAAVTAEAAHWMRNRDGAAHVTFEDIDNDGYREIVLRNDALYAVITPKWGGRLVALYSIAGERGAMVVGNPCDDWNLTDELNVYLEAPRNHPGAFADVGRENETFEVGAYADLDGCSAATLHCRGMSKTFSLESGSHELRVRYELPGDALPFATEAGLSPDYLELLRRGAVAIRPFGNARRRGFDTCGIGVYMAMPDDVRVRWTTPYQASFSHGCMLRVESAAPAFELRLGVSIRDAELLAASEAVQLQTVAR